MKDYLIIICVLVAGFFAFREWSLRTTPVDPPVAVDAGSPPAAPASPASTPPNLPEATTPAALAASRAAAAPAAPVSSGAGRPGTVPQPAADRTNLEAAARRTALAKYPDLGQVNTEINSRFVFRYQQLRAANSPRLQDPAWPLLLADECAIASGLAARAIPAGVLAPPPLAARLPAPAATHQGQTAWIPVASSPQTTGAAGAQEGSSQPPLIALDVRSMNAGTSYTVTWLTYYDGYDVSGRANKALDLDARNLSARNCQVALQWVFTARKPHQDRRFIFDSGSSNWDMKSSQAVHFGVRSKDLSSRSVWYYGSGMGNYQGAEMDGWIVPARYQGKIIKAVGSTSTLESLASTPAFDDMLSA